MKVNSFFNETFSRDEDDIKLYKFLKSNFTFCDIVYCDDKQHNIGFNYDGHRYFIRSCNGYMITNTINFNDSFFKNLNDVKDELIRIITPNVYSRKITEYRQKKLERIVNESIL